MIYKQCAFSNVYRLLSADTDTDTATLKNQVMRTQLYKYFFLKTYAYLAYLCVLSCSHVGKARTVK